MKRHKAIEKRGEINNCDDCYQETFEMDVLTSNGWKKRRIETCIVPLVRELNKFGIPTEASCCGHKSGFGSVCIDPRHVEISFNGQREVMITIGTVDKRKVLKAVHGNSP